MVGYDEMASREILEDVIERLITQLRLVRATLISTSEEFRQAGEKLETLEKEHKRVVHQIGELKEGGSKLISERDEAEKSAEKALGKVSEIESKQFVFKGQSAKSTRVKPKNFSGCGNDTDFKAFLDQFEVCARMNDWKKANQLVLCMKEKARVVVTRLSTDDKNCYGRMVKAISEKIGMR